MIGRAAAIASSVMLGGCSVFGIRTTEEPHFTVIDHVGPVEIRQYGPRLAADTVVSGSEYDARYEGFQRLAGYIFGANKTSAKIEMTAPVGESTAGAKIEMTAPVAQQETPTGWRIRFFMPSGSTLQILPVPDDKRVSLVEVPGETVAALRFTGARDHAAIEQRQAELSTALQGSKWTPAGESVAWFYDPPWTIPWLRRNEVAVPVVAK